MTVEQLEREVKELKAALKRGEYFVKHARKHKTGGQDPVGAGGSVTVSDIDGTPSVAGVTEIKFSNGTVTDNGDGTATVVTTGGGAAVGNSYVVLSAADIDPSGDLTAARVLTEGAGILLADSGDIGATSTVTISARIREIQLSLGEMYGYTV